MIVYLCAVSFLFWLLAGLSGYATWGSEVWWYGLAVGSGTAFAWFRFRRAGKQLGMVGLVLLVAIALGFGNDLTSEGRTVFNGASIGFGLAGAVIAYLRWETLRQHLIIVARHEGHQWLLRMLGEEE